MSKLALDRFLALVERCGLVAPEQLAHAITEWKRAATASQLDDAAACADHLVHLGLLTSWQAHKLLEGRHRGFFLGGYKLLGHLGSGGMSNVYLAEHVLMQRLVAIKVLPQHRAADGSYLARFHFEGQAVAALDHPNIVRAYDLGNEGRIHYFVMEYVEGSDLEALLGRIGPLDFYVAAGYVAQAAAGLEYAHGRGLVHRDIKPANLLVDRQGTVKILDMGLAKFQTEALPTPEFAQEEQVLGTANYFAPEQAVNAQAVDHRADIYGLGCTFYFLLTGHPPFSAGTATELAAAHRGSQPASVLVDRPDAPRALVAICEKMMEKSPAARYQSASDVAKALASWLEAERAAGRAAWPAAAELDAVARAASALRDTEPNLHETARSAPPVARSSGSGNASDVLSLDDSVISPPPPPVVPPPRDAPNVPIPTVVPLASGTRKPSVGRLADAAETLQVRRPATAALGRYRDATRMSWLWAIVLSTLVLGALLLALFAFAG